MSRRTMMISTMAILSAKRMVCLSTLPGASSSFLQPASIRMSDGRRAVSRVHAALLRGMRLLLQHALLHGGFVLLGKERIEKECHLVCKLGVVARPLDQCDEDIIRIK